MQRLWQEAVSYTHLDVYKRQELMAVVKAEAYGHGGAVTARTLQRAGVRAFAVACLAEGIALRLSLIHI